MSIASVTDGLDTVVEVRITFAVSEVATAEDIATLIDNAVRQIADPFVIAEDMTVVDLTTDVREVAIDIDTEGH